MYSIVGLGNPGKEYSKNRHNAGFIIIDEITSFFDISDWKSKNKGSITKGKIKNQSVVFLKPGTFMNLSGKSVFDTINFYKVPSENVLVIHDDLDLEIGKIKAKFGGGNAGHNGLGSISNFIGNNYLRLRIGIGHPGKDYVSRYVLEDFKEDEMKILTKNIDYIKKNIHLLISDQLNDFNKKINNV